MNRKERQKDTTLEDEPLKASKMLLRKSGSWKESNEKSRQHLKKQRHHLANKSPHSQGYGFSCSDYGSESWTIRKADHRRIDASKLWCWRRLLRVPWTARRTNLSILKEINPECSLEGQILKLRLQYFDHLMRRLLGKDTDVGKV